MRQEFPAADEWTVEVNTDESIFVRYKGIDVLAVWLPGLMDGQPSISIPSEGQFREFIQRIDEYAGDMYVEWAVGDEMVVELAKHCELIDVAREEEAKELRKSRALIALRERAQDDPVIREYLEAHERV